MAGGSQPEFGRQLRRLRQERGLSQRQLADGFTTPSYVSLLESGQRSPTLEVLVSLAGRLELPIGALTEDTSQRSGATSDGASPAKILALRSRGASDDAARAQREAFDDAAAQRRDSEALGLGVALLAQLPDTDTLGRVEVFTRLVEVSRQLDEPDATIGLAIDLAAALRTAGAPREAVHVARDALAESNAPDGSPTLQVRASSVLISALSELGETEEIPALVERMLTLAATIDNATAARAAWTASIAFRLMGRADDAVEQIHEARPLLAQASTTLRDWLRFSRSAAAAFLAAGDLDNARAWLQAAEPVAASVDLDHETAQLAALQAEYALAVGDARAAISWYDHVKAAGSLSITDRAAANLVQVQALRAEGQVAGALALAAATAAECDAASAYRLAAHAWRLSAELSGEALRD